MSDPTPTESPKPPPKVQRNAVIKGVPLADPGAPMVPARAGMKMAPVEIEEVIPVALVEWDRMWKPPGKSAEQTLRTHEGNDGRGWKVEFLPSLRMMRVTHTDKTRPERGGVRLVPIERVVSWEAG
jgi:hypothetical protein